MSHIMQEELTYSRWGGSPSRSVWCRMNRGWAKWDGLVIVVQVKIVTENLPQFSIDIGYANHRKSTPAHSPCNIMWVAWASQSGNRHVRKSSCTGRWIQNANKENVEPRARTGLHLPITPSHAPCPLKRLHTAESSYNQIPSWSSEIQKEFDEDFGCQWKCLVHGR